MNFAGDHFKEDGDWIWTSFCSEEKYLLGIHADGRGKIVAERFVNGELDKLKKGHMPIFATDGYRPYSDILLARYGRYRLGNRGRGRPGMDKLIPDPDLNYGIVEKTRNGKKLLRVRRYVRFGHVPEEFLNTSAIERDNLTNRLFSSRLRRRTTTFSRSKETTELSLQIHKAFYNLCRPHSSLSIPRKMNDGTYVPVTPAMKMGLTSRVWTLHEVMVFPYRQNINQIR
jgi:IS1 family transposase